MDVTIRDGRRHWSLADNYWRMLSRSGESQDIGIACCGAWSPNGEQIGFFASADALGHEGIDRAQGEYKLYLMDSDRLEPEPILDGVYYANQLAWSPDGKWLAFTGQRHGSSGIWLFSPQERLLVRVTNDPIESFSWSPDGSKLAATRYCEGCRVRFSEERVTTDDGEEILIPECNPLTCRQLVIYDVSAVLHNP